MTTLPVHSRTRVLFTLLFALLLPATEARGQQATLDGNVIIIPVVVFGDLFYEIQLGLIPDTNPPELELVGGWEVFNKESEVEFKTGVNGTWTITEDVSPGSCEFDPYTDSYELEVIRDGDSLFVTSAEGEYSGTISGNSLAWSGTFEDEQEESSLTTSASVTFSPDEDSITGGSSWTLTLGEDSCSGTTVITGELTTPEEIPYEEVTTDDPTMPYVLNSVDESATEFDGLVLSIPSITVNGVNFWADLELVSDNPIQFRLIGSGLSDVQMGLLWNQNSEEFNGAVFNNESLGPMQLNINPVTGLLQEAIINGDLYVFTNYTATTVDLIHVELDNPPQIILDIPLSDSAQAYVAELTGEQQPDASQLALSLPGFGTGTMALAVTTEQEGKKETALNWIGKGLEFIKEVFEEAGESESYKIPDLERKIVRDYAKSFVKKVLRSNIDSDIQEKVDTIMAGVEAASTKLRCTAITPTLDWAMACVNRVKNSDELNADIDAAIALGFDVMELVRQRRSEEYRLRIEAAMGCDFYDSDADYQECDARWSGKPQGKSQPVLDTDRDNNGQNDANQDKSPWEWANPLLAWFDEVKKQEAVYGEKYGRCPRPLSNRVDIYYGFMTEGGGRGWWGCQNAGLRNMGVWTFYETDVGPVTTQTYLNGVLHGPYWHLYNYDGSYWITGYYADGMKFGPWAEYRKEGETVVNTKLITYENDVENGPFLQRDFEDSGTIITGQYLNGNRDGEWIHTVGGELYELDTWKEGVLDGPSETHYEDGSSQIGQYANNVQDGAWKYYVDGKLEKTVTFQNGVVVDVKWEN